MLKLHSETNEERIILARGVIALCLNGFDRLLKAADFRDGEIRALIQNRIDKELEVEDELRRFDWKVAGIRQECFDHRRYDALLRKYVPSLFVVIGEGPLFRDVVLYLMESLEEERFLFFDAASHHSSHHGLVHLFSREKEISRQRLLNLQGLLLLSDANVTTGQPASHTQRTVASLNRP